VTKVGDDLKVMELEETPKTVATAEVTAEAILDTVVVVPEVSVIVCKVLYEILDYQLCSNITYTSIFECTKLTKYLYA
jgi:hypothetical protein